MTLAILGVTGYTGRLVLAEARRAGLPVRLVGRRQDALNALAQPGEEVRVADARSLGTLREAFAGASVVASCAGPFLELGLAPVEAAIAEGAHYLDAGSFFSVTIYKLGDTYYGARSNEFGYANYEIIPTPQFAVNPLTAMINQFSIELGLTQQQKQQIVPILKQAAPQLETLKKNTSLNHCKK